jgi:hypothetical protein
LATQVEQHLYLQFNQLRAAEGLPPVAPDEELAGIARNHSADMLHQDYFGHRDQHGEGPSERVANGHRRLVGLVGENLWSGFHRPECTGPGYAKALATEAIERFLGSPPHRRNLLRADYTHTGFGVVVGRGHVLVTQLLADVKAYTSQAVPEEVESGYRLEFRLAEGTREAAGFDIRPLAGAIPLAVPFQPGEMILDLPSGRYRVYFYFRESGTRRYHIYPGPAFRIVPQSLADRASASVVPAR